MIGALIGILNVQLNEKIDNVKENNITIIGTDSYIGGTIGRQYGDNVTIKNITINDSNITGGSNTGGIFGTVENGYFSYFTVNNTNITGLSYVGGVFGYASNWRTGWKSRTYMEVNSSTISGTESYIGGIAGYSAVGDNGFWSVKDTEIIANNANSLYVGGLIGHNEQGTICKFQIENITITGNASSVGGAIGNCVTRAYLNSGYIKNAEIKGNQNIGGLCGNISALYINDIYVNAKVNANNSNAGGIVGYMSNTYMEEGRNTIQIDRVAVLDSSVTAPTKAGGMIGDIAVDIYRDKSFYYNNYIDAVVTSQNTSTGSLLIGGRPDENPYITNTYVYKYSTLNGDYVYGTNDNIENEQYLTREDLDKQNTYSSKIGLGTTYWNYSYLSEGKYPKIKDEYLNEPELQTGVDLPTDPDITELNLLSNKDENDNNNTNEVIENDDNSLSTQSVEPLPIWTVYTASVDEVNVDFSSVPEGISFTYYINGEEKETVELTKKTYTFKYNYQDTLEIKLTNGVYKDTITITPDDVRSEVSLVGDSDAYILGTSLYINGEVQDGNYVNVYNGLALNSSGQIVDIATKETTSEAVTTALLETEKTVNTYNYNGNNIEVYGTYSKVNNNIKLQIYNARNGQLSALSNNLDMKTNNYIVDNYNNKEYQTILSKEGEITDLKEMLQYPDNFFNRNIKQIVQNSDQEKTEMMALYNTGKVIVFNYVTGNVIYENQEKADTSLADYITGSVSNIWNDYEEKQAEYEKSKELAEKLEKMPIEEALQKNVSDNTNKVTNNNINVIGNADTKDSYITVYNGNTDEYEVYSEDEILAGKEETPVSETTKIKENGLESVYNYEAKEETKPQANGAVIVVAIIGVAIIALIILRKIVVKNNNKKEKHK